MKARIAAVTVALASSSLAFAGSAHADTAPQLLCGSTVMTSCSDSAHYTDLDAWETPLGTTAPGCPSYLAGDYVLMQATGDGLEHISINKNGGFWTNNTFTGTGTITFYDPANVDVTVIDDDGDITATPTGAPDTVLSGHLTQSFGAEQTRQGLVFGNTFAFGGTDTSGKPVSIHVTQHQNWNPTHPPFSGPPQHAGSSVHC